MDTGSTFRAGFNTLRFANYFASGTVEDNAGTEMAEVSTSGSQFQDVSVFVQPIVSLKQAKHMKLDILQHLGPPDNPRSSHLLLQ